MFRLKNKFNLVEVAIAIGILAIGVTAIISLFPVGFERSRDAIGENYCADAADSLFAYIAREANSSETDAWLLVKDLPTEKADVADTSKEGEPFSFGDISSSEGDIYYGATDETLTGTELGATAGVYGIKVMTGDVVDFSGEALIWVTPMPNLEVSGESVQINDKSAIGLNMEISWLVEKPYGKRKKNYYYYELHNSNN